MLQYAKHELPLLDETHFGFPSYKNYHKFKLEPGLGNDFPFHLEYPA